MLLNGKKGACFNIIVAMILNQVFDGLTSSWTLLYLVENDNGMPFFQRNIVNELELGKKKVAIGNMVNGLPEFIWSIGKIDNNIAFVLTAGELLSYSGFTYTSCTFYE